MGNKIIYWADIDPNDSGTLLGAYIHNYALVGGIVIPVLTIILTSIYLHPFVLVGFLPCSIIFGILLGGLLGSISARITIARKN